MAQWFYMCKNQYKPLTIFVCFSIITIFITPTQETIRYTHTLSWKNSSCGSLAFVSQHKSAAVIFSLSSRNGKIVTRGKMHAS